MCHSDFPTGLRYSYPHDPALLMVDGSQIISSWAFNIDTRTLTASSKIILFLEMPTSMSTGEECIQVQPTCLRWDSSEVLFHGALLYEEEGLAGKTLHRNGWSLCCHCIPLQLLPLPNPAFLSVIVLFSRAVTNKLLAPQSLSLNPR